MIFTKYLVSEVLKNQLIILLVLFFIFLSQRFVRAFIAVIDGSIPKFLFFLFFGLSIPEIIKLILPISLFFSILITFNHLHINNEIVAMYSCGLGDCFIIRRIFLLSSVTVFFSIINLMFLSPFCLWYQHQLILKCQSSLGVVKLFGGQCQFLRHIHSMFFFKKVNEGQFQDIYLIRIFPNGYYSIIVANHGFIEKCYDGSQWFILDSGNYYFWNRNNIFYSNFYVNHFNQFKVMFVSAKESYCRNDVLVVTEMSMRRLWNFPGCEARAEFHWRLTLIIVVFIMVMIISPLSLRTLNNSLFLNVFPSLLLCLLFFLLQIFLRSNISKGYIDPIWMWLVSFFYIFIAVILNFWDSIIFRNFRWKLKLIYNRD